MAYTYKLKFNNDQKFKLTAENLDEAYVKIINYINKKNLKSCIIFTPNNKMRKVIKTGEYHWNHDGFTFL